MWDEFKKSVMNSFKNISVWIEREITSTEIYNYLICRIDSLIDQLNDLDTKEEQMKFVNIPKAANYDNFFDIMIKKILSLISFLTITINLSSKFRELNWN